MLLLILSIFFYSVEMLLTFIEFYKGEQLCLSFKYYNKSSILSRKICFL